MIANSKFRISLVVVCVFAVGLVAGIMIPTTYSQQPNVAPEVFVTGIGGIFFRTDDPDESKRWYRENLGIGGEGAGVNFFWRNRDNPDALGFTVWSVFSSDTDYFGPTQQEFMINYRVHDLDALLVHLGERGVEQVGEIDEYSYGRFAWIVDGDGRKVELWEPAYLSADDFQ